MYGRLLTKRKSEALLQPGVKAHWCGYFDPPAFPCVLHQPTFFHLPYISGWVCPFLLVLRSGPRTVVS